MRLRNKATLLIIDQIDTVQVAFENYLAGATRLYTYKCKKGEFKPNDQAIVVTSGKYKIVTVIAVDETPNVDPNANWDYEWLVQKLDLTQYNKCLAAEQTLMDYLTTATRKKLMREALEVTDVLNIGG